MRPPVGRPDAAEQRLEAREQRVRPGPVRFATAGTGVLGALGLGAQPERVQRRRVERVLGGAERAADVHRGCLRVVGGQRERRAGGGERGHELAREAVVHGRVELPPSAVQIAAQRVQRPGRRAPQRGGGARELHPPGLREPLRRLVPAAQPQQVVGGVDEHEVAERAAQPQPRRLALALEGRRQRGRVVAAHAQQLAEVHVSACGLLAGPRELQRAPQVGLPRLRLAEEGQHDAERDPRPGQAKR